MQMLMKFWMSCPSAGWFRVPAMHVLGSLVRKVSVRIQFDSKFVTLDRTGGSTLLGTARLKELKQ